MRYAQAAQITDESRLLYILIKMLKNRPQVSHLSSPTKAAGLIKGQYKRIADRVRDDPVLSGLDLPLPNINNKSITAFMSKEEKKANYFATTVPKVSIHQRVLSDKPMPEAPLSLQHFHHQTGNKCNILQSNTCLARGLVRRKGLTLMLRNLNQSMYKSHSTTYQYLLAPLCPNCVQSQPCLTLYHRKLQVCLFCCWCHHSQRHLHCHYTSQGAPFTFKPPSAPPPPRRFMPNQSSKPCAACQVPKCGGLRKRYTPSKDKTEGSKQKIFTFCPATRKSTTPGFEGVFDDYEHFKRVVDEELQRRKDN